MNCPACGNEHAPTAKFCPDCGTPLARNCANCGAAGAPGAKFCAECGTPFAAAATPPAAPAAQTERRVCSVLFADLVGFTPLSESRDPEEVRELLSGYFDTARTVITRYGGVVEKFIGDAVMAVWGTPVAAEGDAERTVRAALELVAAIQAMGAGLGADGLALRAGVVTGEVAASIGAVGEGMVAGDAVNTAARVQSAATPGTVWVDTATQRLAAAAIGFADAGRHELKGKTEAQQLWQATRVLSSVGGAQRVDGLEAPMLGRDAELRTVKELFHATADRGSPRVVTVAGVAGSGKSRLGWEFEKYADGVAFSVWWHRGRCLSYGDGVAYWALAEAVRQRFGIAADDPVDEAADKLVRGLPEWVPDVAEQLYVGVRLGRLLGLVWPGDAGATVTREDLFAGWRLFLERLAASAPVVLVVEDAHHADDGLLEFVQHVVDWARQSPIFIVLMTRPELLERHPTLAGGRNRTSLYLDALDERAMREVVAALVDGLPVDAVAAIVAQAEGNPLFAIETVRTLIDRDVIVPKDGRYRLVGDVGTLTVPDSLHGLLASRLDRLEPELRALIADAAVLGTSFPAEALAAVADRTDVTSELAALVRAGILEITTDPLSPERGAYVFAQGMLRQVAYDTLSRRDRRTRHLVVAEHLQRTFAAGGDEVMEVVAQHYLDALAAVSGPDDDEVRDRAIECLTRAAERSLRAGAQERAAVSFERAAELLDEPIGAGGLLERAQAAFGAASMFERAIRAGERSGELFGAAGRERDTARVLANNGRWLIRGRRLIDGVRMLDTVLEVLRIEPDVDTVVALTHLTYALSFAVDPRLRSVVDEALQLAQDLDVPPIVLAETFAAAGTAAQMSARPAEGTALLSYATQLAEREGDTAALSRSLNNLATGQLLADREASAESARAAMDGCRRIGDKYMLAAATTTLAEALLWQGNWDEIETEMARLEDDLGELDEDGCVQLGVVRAMRGDLETADRLAELPTFRTSDDAQDAVYVAWLDGARAAASEDHPRALQALTRVLTPDGDTAVCAWFWSWPLAVRCALALDDLDAARALMAVVDGRPVGQLPSLLRANRAVLRLVLAARTEEPSDAQFAVAIDQLRAAASPYHLAHGLLDLAEYQSRSGQDPSAARDEARLLGEQLGAADVERRLAAAVPSAR